MEKKNTRGGNSSPNKGNPKKGAPKKQFNFYWIYGIIGVLLLGLQLFNMGGGEKKTTWDKFVNEMLKTNEVEKLVVVTTGTESRAEIFIKSEALQQDKYKDVKDKGSSRIGARTAQYFLKIGTIDQFNTDLNRVQKDLPEENKVYPEYAGCGKEFL